MRSRLMLRLWVVRVRGPTASIGGEVGAGADLGFAVESAEAGSRCGWCGSVMGPRICSKWVSPKNSPSHGDGAVEVGEGEVVGVAFDGDVAGDAVGGEGRSRRC